MGDFFKKVDEGKVVEAIHAEEARSHGEIRVHVTEGPVSDVLREGAAVFEKLGMTKTAERNGILIFVAATDHRFAVLGDIGITSRCGMTPLEEIAAALGGAFREGRFTEGLVSAVHQSGALLAKLFPSREGAENVDELSNEISRG